MSAPTTERRCADVTNASPHYLRLAGLSWLHFLNDGAANYLPGVLPAVLLAVGLDSGYAGTVMSALLIGQSLQVISGHLADHVGGRLLILFGLLGSSAGAAAIGWVDSVAALVPALLAIGLANALFHPQALAGARSLSASRPGLGMSLFLVGGEVGRGLWPLLASLVVVHLGLHGLWLLSLPALLSIALLWRWLPQQAPRPAHAERLKWRYHLGARCALVGFSLLRALAIFGTVTYVPELWEQGGRSLVDGAAAIAVLLVVGIVGNVGGGHLADRIGRRVVMAGSSLAGAILFVGFILAGSGWQWPLLGLLGIALFASLPLGILAGQDLFPENRSLGSGIALGLSNGLAALALLGLDPLARACGTDAVLWVLAAALLVSAAVPFALPGD